MMSRTSRLNKGSIEKCFYSGSAAISTFTYGSCKR